MKTYSGHSIAQNPASPCPPEWSGQLVAIPVRFIRFYGGGRRRVTDTGIIEVHCDLAEDVEEFFEFMMAVQFPLSSVKPLSFFGWNDEHSMAANNTSGFNRRKIAGTERWSKHAFGGAIDINPLLNPCVCGGIVQPAGAVYDPSRLGALTANSPITQFLKARGWTWGGDWDSPKDYQHFQKP